MFEHSAWPSEPGFWIQKSRFCVRILSALVLFPRGFRVARVLRSAMGRMTRPYIADLLYV